MTSHAALPCPLARCSRHLPPAREIARRCQDAARPVGFTRIERSFPARRSFRSEILDSRRMAESA